MNDTTSSDNAYDLDFHFDPGCPFSWQTSRWVTRVAELTGISVHWRFISLKFLNENQPENDYTRGHIPTHRYLRVLAAIRAEMGDEPIWRLYTAWGQRMWYSALPEGGPAALATGIDVAELLRSEGIDERFAAEADNEAWDTVIRSETDAAIDRTGPDVGTPILTFWPTGNAYFGPVISSLPNDEDAVKIYDALRTLVDFDTFSEIKRTKRPTLDLPVFAS